MPYPQFLQRQKKQTSKRMLKNVVSDYNPLLGAWMTNYRRSPEKNEQEQYIVKWARSIFARR